MTQKPRSIQQIEERMTALEPESYRYQVLGCARDFKSSWIRLGQYLFSIYKDKLYKDWDYLTFEAYCAKEIGIKQPTAVKLLKSYAFLEKEEPAFVKKEKLDDRRPTQIPGFEAVNALRLAKESERLSPQQYASLREDVLENPKEDKDIKQKIRYVLRSTASPKDAAADKEERRRAMVKRLMAQLGTCKDEFTNMGLPAKIMKKIDELVDVLADFQ